MSTIDEIMAAAYAPAASAAEGRSFCPRLAAAKLRTLITQAIAEARAEGAREMREAADALREDADEIFPPSKRGRQASVEMRDVVEWYSESIRALPLPAGTVNVVMDREHGGLTFAPAEREPVRLTDEQIKQARNNALCGAPDGVLMGRVAGLCHPELRELSRAIETAVLAANGMTE